MKAIDYEEENTKRVTALELTGGPAHGGLTVLDWFAGKALEGLVNKSPLVLLPVEEECEMFGVLARGAYDYAEAMMAERKKRYTPANVVTGVTGKHYG